MLNLSACTRGLAATLQYTEFVEALAHGIKVRQCARMTVLGCAWHRHKLTCCIGGHGVWSWCVVMVCGLACGHGVWSWCVQRQIAERDEADRHLQLGNLFSAPSPSPARQPSPAPQVQQPPLNLNGVRPGGGSVRGHARSSRSRGKVGSGSMRGSHNREHGGHSVKHVEKLFADRLFSKFSKVRRHAHLSTTHRVAAPACRC